MLNSVFNFLHIILNLNLYLGPFFNHYGIYAYLTLFLILFCETGLVITPFLPGDSLLFSLGMVLGDTHQSLFLLLPFLILAIFLGDNTNYFLGRLLGPKIFHTPTRWLNPKHLETTHRFYESYGGRTLILARFIPIIRTFTPFVAGIGTMPYFKFFGISLFAAVLWLTITTGAGYFLGHLNWVQHYFSEIIFLIILISVLPVLLKILVPLLHRKFK